MKLQKKRPTESKINILYSANEIEAKARVN